MERVREERCYRHVKVRAGDKYPLNQENLHMIVAFVTEHVETVEENGERLPPDEREGLALTYVYNICERHSIPFNTNQVKQFIQLTCKASRGKFVVNAGPQNVFHQINNWYRRNKRRV